MNKNRRKKIKTITVNGTIYKYLVNKEPHDGCTLKIWNNDKILLSEIWYLTSPKEGVTPEFVQKVITTENK